METGRQLQIASLEPREGRSLLPRGTVECDPCEHAVRRNHRRDATVTKDRRDSPLRSPEPVLVDNVGRHRPAAALSRAAEREPSRTEDRKRHHLYVPRGSARDCTRVRAPHRGVDSGLPLRTSSGQGTGPDPARIGPQGRNEVENFHEL